MREQVLKAVAEEKVVAIVRGIEPEKCMKVAQALYDGGIRLMEITYNQQKPDSWQENANTIGAVAKAFAGKMHVGAGTVTNPHLVEITAAAGGEFIISPDANPAVIRRTRELGLVSMPGVLTPTEILMAVEAGADVVKLFPAGEMGTGYLKAIRGPISHVKIMAVGGVNEKNAGDFIAAGACGVGVGGNLANKAWIDAGEYWRITETAKALVAAVKG